MLVLKLLENWVREQGWLKSMDNKFILRVSLDDQTSNKILLKIHEVWVTQFGLSLEKGKIVQRLKE